MKLIKNKLLIIIAIIFLTSCTTAVNVTSSSIKEKGIKEAISDGMIDASINKQFLNHDLNMFVNVEIEVVEGRVLLTGSVKKTKHRLDAIKLSWKVLGVREVINEIDVTDKGGIKKYLVDVKIKTQIRYKVIADKKISSINYNFEAVNGSLFIIGIAQNKKELKKVIEHANNIKSVTKVISHVIMKDDPRRKKYQRKLQEK
ncbi:MAG: hypothetical protein CFH28_00548 [Alphaproteobacteria bacterium MarineAlpha6_Bin6]|nr:BON domain-containing protein [Pelagibacteraceae bacterium]PPR31234.1 MAG: hypothetical protein CFH28_00548 [Alphaproteobacteria bacterium MarineAlpha6_Bin6]PPR33791.1 MAG: hypothetical protein CFH27_00086 [Alphaproteobacteria bacterium MarineAlpha6_Bin5]|tara:strand:+ start:122 stop:724 length:603 start_codon:yes stop_codon:yes gene_type:complete